MKILFVYGGGREVDKAALEVAKKHAKAFQATVYVAASTENGPDGEGNDTGDIKKQLVSVKEELAAEGISAYEKILNRGLMPGQEMVDFAVDEKMDEMIIGLERRSKVGKLLFSAGAQYMMMEAPCPVVSVK